MGLISWFKNHWLTSEERKEFKKLQEEKLKQEGVKEHLEKLVINTPIELIPKKPYSHAYYNGTGLTLVFKDETISKDCDFETYNRVKECATKEEILSILFRQEQKDDVIIEKNDLAILEVNDNFIVKGKEVYLKGVSLQIPNIIVCSFIEVLEKQLAESSSFNTSTANLKKLEQDYQALKMFWLKLATNSIPTCRESVLEFCKNNDIRLTKTGNIIAYRNVVTWKKSNDLSEYLNKLKNELLNYDNYYVLKHKNSSIYSYVHKYTNKNRYPKDYINLGKLSEIEITDSEIVYTSDHNRGRYSFKIGDLYKLDENDKPDSNVGNCSSSGLHAASVNWDYSGFGDTKVVVLINPARTIFTPSSDSGKFRCSEMKIACLNPNDYGVHIDESLIEQADNEYNEYTIQELEQIAKSKNFSSLSVSGNNPLVNSLDLENITLLLKNKTVKI